jgi:hypothetical protein
MERFSDVVISAGIHACHLVAPPLASGQDQYGHLAVIAPPLLEDRETVFLRQANVEDDRVVGLRIAEEVTLFAIERRIDGISCVAKRGDELTIEIWIVLYDEKPQRTALPWRLELRNC